MRVVPVARCVTVWLSAKSDTFADVAAEFGGQGGGGCFRAGPEVPGGPRWQRRSLVAHPQELACLNIRY